MTKSAIQIKNLGKSYTISHKGTKGSSYVALRDVLAEKAKTLFTPSSWFSKGMKTEEFWALKDINLDIQKGDKVAIIGHNGAGKSTLLKILSQITEPTTGEIKINGRVTSLLEVGTGFHPELTGRENIYLNGSILGMTHAEVKQKFDEIVKFAGVEKFLDTPVKRYSSGMRMRLGFAVAAHLESEILIIDEVLAVGDAEFQKKCLGKMDDISKSEGRTILFVSHNMGAVKALCNKGVVLNKGKSLYQGNVNDAVNCYFERIKTQHIITQRSEALLSYKVNEPYEVPPQNPITISVSLETNTNLTGMFADISILDNMNHHIIVKRGQLLGEFFDIPKGKSTLLLELDPMHLHAGTYYAYIHIAEKGNKNILLQLHNVKVFVIEGVPPHHKINGYISPPHKLKIEKV